MKKYILITSALIVTALASFLLLTKKPSKNNIDIIGVGFPRSGTTHLFYKLDTLPHLNRIYRVFDSEYKIQNEEPYFFGNLSLKKSVTLRPTENRRKKVFKPAIKYYQYFLKEDAVNYEKSPQYIWKKSTLEEIYAFNPDVKILLQVRHPINWLYSWYKLCQDTGLYGVTQTMTFKEFLSVTQPEAEISLKECGRFITFAQNVYDVFPRENIYFIAQEELTQFKTIFDICDFLEIERPTQNAPIDMRPGKSYERLIDQDLYSELLEYYQSSNQELFDLIGRSISGWDS